MTSKRPLRRRRFRIFRTLGLALLVMIVAGTILAFTPAPSLTATVSPPDRPAGDSQLPWLRTEQRQIDDAMGRRVLLRGFNDDALVSYPNDPPAPAAWVANTYFWTSSDWQKDFFFTWKAVASRFPGVSGVAGYDLFNEPLPLPIPPRLFEKYCMWPLYQHAIEAVGSVDGNHLFFLEGILLFTLDTLMVPLHAPNLVYGNHIYEGSLVPPLWNGDPGPVQHTFAVR